MVMLEYHMLPNDRDGRDRILIELISVMGKKDRFLCNLKNISSFWEDVFHFLPRGRTKSRYVYTFEKFPLPEGNQENQ
jgi:hypothetical protein